MRVPEWLSWTAPLWVGILFFGWIAAVALLLSIFGKRVRSVQLVEWKDIDAVREEGL